MGILYYIESHPIIDIGKTAEDLSMAYNSIATCVDKLEHLGILCAVKEQSRNKTYSYKQYLDILSDGTELEV